MTSKTSTAAVAALLTVLLYGAFAQQPAKIPSPGAVPNVVPEKIPNALEEAKPVPAENHIGRYQITGLAANSYFVLVDTHTGQCWIKAPAQPWHDQGTPVK